MDATRGARVSRQAEVSGGERLQAAKEAATMLSALPAVILSSYVPCRPPHPDVPQTHVAPRDPSIAVLALVYSDTTGPITDSLVRSWYEGPALDYVSRISDGCTQITLTPFIVDISETEKDADGNCRTQGESWESLAVPAIAGFNQSDYFATHIVPVSQTCSTSGGVGTYKLTIDGALETFTGAMGMGHNRANEGNSNTNRLGEEVGFSPTYVHELIHLLGAGYHSNKLQCLTPMSDQTDVLACPSNECMLAAPLEALKLDCKPCSQYNSNNFESHGCDRR